jgi:phytoene dehydrogenase-like protein
VPLQMGYFRPNDTCSQCYTPVEGFYVCGAGLYPGGMIIGSPGYIGANTVRELIYFLENLCNIRFSRKEK